MHENLNKNVNENMFSFTILYKFSCICNFAIFVRIFIKFSPKCRTKKLGMIYTILGGFSSFLNCIGLWPIFGPKSGLGKSLDRSMTGDLPDFYLRLKKKITDI